jgi:hypothetical protein
MTAAPGLGLAARGGSGPVAIGVGFPALVVVDRSAMRIRLARGRDSWPATGAVGAAYQARDVTCPIYSW